MSDLGSLLRAKREREGLGLRAAGAASGIAWSTLGRIENGGEPSARVDRAARAWLNGEAPLLPTPPMTLRDWFASQADIRAYGPADAYEKAYGREPTISDLAEFIAEIRLIEADAMLAARSAS